MLNSLLSEFGSNKSVGDHTGRVMSTAVLAQLPSTHRREHSHWEAEEPEDEREEEIPPVNPSLPFLHWCKEPSLNCLPVTTTGGKTGNSSPVLKETQFMPIAGRTARPTELRKRA